jgi:hypothetical protein
VKATAVLFLLLIGVWPAAARLQETVPMEADSGVDMTVSSCFDSVTPGGFTPVDVTINNHSGAARRWEITFSSPGYFYGGTNRTQSVFSLTVENNLTRTTTLLVPIGALARVGVEAGRPNPLQVTVTGHGARTAFVQLLGGRGSGKTPSSFIVISESLGTPIWSALSARLQSFSVDLEGSTVKLDDLPEDWRGLTGVAALWLTADELSHLSAGQRQAVQTWVRTGGQLVICGTKSPPADFRDTGFGRVKIFELPTLQVGDLANELRTTRAPFDIGAFPKSQRLEAVKPNVPLLAGFMGIFAAVVGPFNIFVLARRHRERLFWTTPLISVGASGLLALIIILQDGIGGSGIRIAAVHLFPDSHSAVLIQKQISRTGLLLNSAFEIRDPVWMEAVEADPEKPSPGRNLRMTGRIFDQGWFASRALQAQRIVTVLSTRAEITLTNQSETANGAAPVVVSSFDEPLQELLYTDDHHQSWRGSDLRTGQKQSLQQDKRGGPEPAPGFFSATAEHSAEHLATLDSIRWKDEALTYTGPVTVPH